MLAHLPRLREVLEPRLKQLLSDQESDTSGHATREARPTSAGPSSQVSTLTGHALQLQRAQELISRIDRDIGRKEVKRGYDLAKPDLTRIGHVSFNIGGPNPGKYRVYVYQEFSDPRGLFYNNSGGGQARRGWTCLVDPENEDEIQYVVEVLESSYDQT